MKARLEWFQQNRRRGASLQRGTGNGWEQGRWDHDRFEQNGKKSQQARWVMGVLGWREHGETCWRGVLEWSGGLGSGAHARPTVDVGVWAVMPWRTREAVRVGADAAGGGCARESRSISERLDCVQECGKQGQQLRARVGEAWGGGEIVRSSHP